MYLANSVDLTSVKQLALTVSAWKDSSIFTCQPAVSYNAIPHLGTSLLLFSGPPLHKEFTYQYVTRSSDRGQQWFECHNYVKVMRQSSRVGFPNQWSWTVLSGVMQLKSVKVQSLSYCRHRNLHIVILTSNQLFSSSLPLPWPAAQVVFSAHLCTMWVLFKFSISEVQSSAF